MPALRHGQRCILPRGSWRNGLVFPHRIGRADYLRGRTEIFLFGTRVSTLYSADHDALDEIALGNKEHYDRRNSNQHGGGHNRAPRLVLQRAALVGDLCQSINRIASVFLSLELRKMIGAKNRSIRP